MGKTVSDMSGSGSETKTVNSIDSTRNTNSTIGGDGSAASDKMNAQQAKNAQELGNPDAASRHLSSIVDQNLRIQTYIELYGSQGDQGPPAGLFEDGNGGIKDPNSLFFMMILYMDTNTPSIKWDKLLKAANNRTKDGSFIQGRINDSFLPFKSTAESGSAPKSVAPIVANKGNQAELTKDFEKNRKDISDIHSGSMPANSSGGGGELSNVVVWPFQNLPLVPGGINKTVDWSSAQFTATGFAEGGFAINGGAKNIEINVEFNYAVGIPGIGDNIPTDSSATKDGNSTSDQASTSSLKYWTVEDLMGVCYLAQSLVLPWESTTMIATEDDVSRSAGVPYFPVVFVRHYSLFPYLSPFVVTAVKIEPDEGQPLIITNKNRMKDSDTSLNYSAIRQTVKITLSLMSASGYAGLFQGNDSGVNIQKITSGKSYKQLASQLLGGRIQ